MILTPAHRAVWAYVEHCCDTGKIWPKMRDVAADLARDEKTVRMAFAELERWAILATAPGKKHTIMVRLFDGRETRKP